MSKNTCVKDITDCAVITLHMQRLTKGKTIDISEQSRPTTYQISLGLHKRLTVPKK